MDVLRPNLLNLGGKIYRVYPNKQNVGSDSCSFDNFSASDDFIPLNEDRGIPDSEEKIEKIGENFKLSLEGIPSAYFKFIIGKKGDTKKKVERETSTTIVIPKRNTEGDIEVHGKSRSGVLSARTRIEVIIENARQNQAPTHFLAFPIESKVVHDKFETFQRNVMRTCGNCRGVGADIFQSAVQLHLTLGMMTINSVGEKEEMTTKLLDVYHHVQSQHSLPTPLSVDVSGIEYMNDDPSEVDVLYAKLGDSPTTNRLGDFCNALVDECMSRGLIKGEQRHLKLHITIMNSKFRQRREEEEHANTRRKRVTFDARKITQMYKDNEFGIAELDKLVVATRGSFDESGRYNYAIEIPLTK